jgi:hypothetical protein
MYRKGQFGGLAGSFDHPRDASSLKRLTTLIDKDVRSTVRASRVDRLDPVSLLLPLQQLETVHLVTFQIVDAICAALQSANDNSALG